MNVDIDNKTPIPQPVIDVRRYIVSFLCVIFFLTSVYFAHKFFELNKTINLSESSTTSSQTERAEMYIKQLAEQVWESPTQTQKLYYEYSPDFGDYRLILSVDGKESNIGRSNEPLYSLTVSWSPDELFMVVSGDILRVFQVERGQRTTISLVFCRFSEGVSPIYWSDSFTAYLSSTELGKDIVSRLNFKPNSEPATETIFYKKEWSGLFAYIPVSISPNGKYLVMEFRYEGAPQLYFMDTSTGKIKQGENFFLGEKPDYSWNGNLLTFRGAKTLGDSMSDSFNSEGNIKEEFISTHTINVSTLF